MAGPGPAIHVLSEKEDVDGRDKPGHDVCFVSSDTDAMTSSGLPIFTTGTLRGS